MRTVNHRTSYTIGEGASKQTKYIVTPISLPETTVELSSWTPELFGDSQEKDITVEYNAKGERVKLKVPFIVAMAIEGYKLHVNSSVRPSNGFEMTDDLLAEFLAANPAMQSIADLASVDGDVMKMLRKKVKEWSEAKK